MAFSDWEPVIGLEIHAQLLTDSKVFSPDSAQSRPPTTDAARASAQRLGSAEHRHRETSGSPVCVPAYTFRSSASRRKRPAERTSVTSSRPSSGVASGQIGMPPP